MCKISYLFISVAIDLFSMVFISANGQPLTGKCQNEMEHALYNGVLYKLQTLELAVAKVKELEDRVHWLESEINVLKKNTIECTCTTSGKYMNTHIIYNLAYFYMLQ